MLRVCGFAGPGRTVSQTVGAYLGIMTDMTLVDVKERSTPSGLFRSRTVVGLLAVGAVIVSAISSYQVGTHHPSVVVRHGHAGSLQMAIYAKAGTKSFQIPLDVAWTDTKGGRHDHGRPECLPPIGGGPDIPVTFSTISFKDEAGHVRTQTVWVDCTGWDPSILTPEQAALVKTY